MARTLGSIKRSGVTKGFKAIWLFSKFSRAEKQLKEEKEKYIKGYNEAIGAKDSEILQYKKKLEDLNLAIQSSKNKEAELNNKLKSREKQIQALENEKIEIGKSKKVPAGESSQEIRYLEDQIRELQHENEELREKLNSAQNNVGSFLKDMAELLDAHEVSTNIGSDNNSFNNPEIEEDLDLYNRVKDKSQGAAYAKAKVEPQRNINLKSGNPISANSRGYKG